MAMREEARTLVADSGSTKTLWAHPGTASPIETRGMNPATQTPESLAETLSTLPLDRDSITELHFYGAGCRPPFLATMEGVLRQGFPNASVEIESDMVGAARATLGHTPGIACILGTGSNSCLYDGQRILRCIPPLGYLLADEGSGTALGRLLLVRLLRRQLPAPLSERLLRECGESEEGVVGRLYKKPDPNRYLASFAPLLRIAIDQGEESLREETVGELRRFLRLRVGPYGQPPSTTPLTFTGGVAYAFADCLEEAAIKEGYAIGGILGSPIGALAEYHLKEQEQRGK